MPTPKMSDNTITLIKRELATGATNRQVARKLKVAMGSVSNVRRDLNNGILQSKQATRRASMAEQQYAEAMKEVGSLRRELDAFTEVRDYMKLFRPVEVKPKHGGKGEATAVICWNDWHFEETVDAEAVNGVNEYNVDIAKKRFKDGLQATASIIDMCRSKSHIDTLIVNVMGDLMTGYIRDELMATNAMTPGEAVHEVLEQVVMGLEFFQKELKLKRIIVPCVCGNHGRWTNKRWAKKGPGMSFEGVLYTFVAKWFLAQKNKVVQIIPPKGDMTFIDVYDRKVRVTHGDNIRYSGGVGGVHIPLRKAIDAWNTVIWADYNYVGHYHQDITGEDYRMSGSLIGYNEYCVKIKARYSPPSQAFELLHPKYGATARFPIVLGTRGI